MADTVISRRAGDDRTRALDAAISQIERAFGKGSVMRLGAAEQAQEIETVSTGSLGLDIALGVGGLPRGRIVEIYGPESSGKTTLTLHVIAEAQKVGGNAAFIDAEHALDPSYAKKLGVKLDDLLISQPDTGEQALEIADTLVRSGAIDVIVVDSVAALVPKAELEGEMGDTHVGLQARLMSQALRKLTASISRSKCMLIFTNQIRSKIGVMFGSPETTTGGNALKFYASVRLDVRRIGPVKDREETVGNQTRVKVVKNKVAPPFRVVEFDIMYGEGVSKTGELIDLGAKAGVVEKSGSWFSYKSQRIGQGRENAKQYLRDHPEMAAEIEQTDPRGGRRRRQGNRPARRGSDAGGVRRTRQLMLHMPTRSGDARRCTRATSGVGGRDAAFATYSKAASPMKSARRVPAGCAAPRPSKDTRNIGPAEITSDEQESAAVLLGHLVGEAVAKVQTRRVHALAPAAIGLRHAPRRGGRHTDDLEPEPTDEPLHLVAEIAPRGDDQRLRSRAGRDQDLVLGFQCRSTGRRRRFVEQDGHQRRGVDRDHRGRPSSS